MPATRESLIAERGDKTVWRCRTCRNEYTTRQLHSRRGLLECPRCLHLGLVDQLEVVWQPPVFRPEVS